MGLNTVKLDQPVLVQIQCGFQLWYAAMPHSTPSHFPEHLSSSLEKSAWLTHGLFHTFPKSRWEYQNKFDQNSSVPEWSVPAVLDQNWLS